MQFHALPASTTGQQQPRAQTALPASTAGQQQPRPSPRAQPALPASTAGHQQPRPSPRAQPALPASSRSTPLQNPPKIASCAPRASSVKILGPRSAPTAFLVSTPRRGVRPAITHVRSVQRARINLQTAPPHACLVRLVLMPRREARKCASTVLRIGTATSSGCPAASNAKIKILP